MSAPQFSETEHAFKPPVWMRPAMVQTLLASLKLRKSGTSPMQEAAREMVLDVGDGVRLLASYAEHPKPKGTMILLHGWEGSQDSTYVISAGRFFYDRGYNIFRLNYRDHGDSHHLNEGLFYAGLFDEVFGGVKAGCALRPDLPAYITGFSIGGNFALRVSRACKADPIDNLKHIFSISPPVDPLSAAPVADESKLVQRYFYKKWSTSLRKKQALFPHLYDFEAILEDRTIMGISEKLLAQYMPDGLKRMEDFFNAYKIWPDDLVDVTTPTHIIMARHDPVLPAADIWNINVGPAVKRIMLDYGGHNGFFQSLRGPTWYDEYILRTLQGDDHG